MPLRGGVGNRSGNRHHPRDTKWQRPFTVGNTHLWPDQHNRLNTMETYATKTD